MQFQPSHSVPHLIRPVAGWLYEEWGRHLPGRSIDTAEHALLQPPDAAGCPSTIIAIDAGEPVGVARLVAEDLECRPDLTPWLASVFVPAHRRGHGIGTHLCSEVVALARRHGFSALHLFTPDRSGFYQRQGWTIIGYEPWRGLQVTLMKLDLREAGGPPDEPADLRK